MSDGGLGIAHVADVETIGSGGSGVVYAATDLKLDRRVAVRLLDPLADGPARDRFTNESLVLGSLSAHPNVVTVYDAGLTEDGRPYMIMELVDGDDLATLLARRGTLPWTEAVDVALQLCAGLEQAHRAGMLHRDLRPDNVLMVGSAPKLTDFGISSGPSAEPASVRSEDPAVMQHRAPETFGEFWDERTDLYSLASMLYQLIDGRAPFYRPSDDSVDALRLRLIHERAPGLAPEIAPPALSAFITAALSKDPFDRPQSADEFAHELRLIREGRTTGSSPSVLHGTSLAATSADPTEVAAPPQRPEPAPLSFSSESHVPVGVGIGATALTQAPLTETAPPPVTGTLADTGPITIDQMMGPPLVGATAMGASALGTQTITGVPPVAAPPSAPALLAFPEPSPEQLAPPSGSSGHTAVYADFASPGGPGLPSPYQPDGPAMPGGGQPVSEADDLALPLISDGTPVRYGPTLEEWSPAFLAAVAMIAAGIIGLLAVLAISAFGSDDTTPAAPTLLDSNQPVAAEGATGAMTVDGATPTSVQADAVAESTTTVEAIEESTTTEITVVRVTVPQVVGRQVGTATEQLEDAGFDVVVVARQSANATPGTVTEQQPAAGDIVTLPVTVTLYIPKASILPPMVGRSAEAVCLELQALAQTCTRVLLNDDRIPAGSVISTSPVEGSLFSEGSSVELRVSRGPVVAVAIPETAGQTAAEAEATLTAAGFNTFANAVETSEAVAKDRVIGTNPAAGSMLPTDQLVTLRVSSGPQAPVTVPQLVGTTTAEAEAALAGVGLTATVVDQDLPAGDENIGKVLSSDPAGGAEVAVGSAVTITVGKQAAESDEGGG